MVPLSFAGVEWWVVEDRALYRPDRRALLVADLHLEKASWYARHGQMLPPYDSLATIDRLERALATCGATSLWCLGDSFHDSDGADRLAGEARQRLAAIADRCALHWITGNHDDALEHRDAVQGVGQVHDEALLDPVTLRHEAEPDCAGYEISGHFHPCLALRLRGRGVRRACFVRSATRLMLPAFGALTGGLDVQHPAIRSAVGGKAEALVPSAGRLLTFPIEPARAA